MASKKAVVWAVEYRTTIFQKSGKQYVEWKPASDVDLFTLKKDATHRMRCQRVKFRGTRVSKYVRQGGKG